jgi:cytochrome bd-type quinol oxidase subunit 2
VQVSMLVVPVPAAIRLGDSVAYPIAGVHCWPASYIAVLEGIYFTTGREVYFRSSMFWIKIFSISFGMGVVSGVVMPFQFGTNWSRFSDATANVLSPLAAIGIVSLWTPFIHEDIARRWFSWPNLLFLSPVPIITALLAWVEWRSLNDDSEIGGVGLFVLAYIGWSYWVFSGKVRSDIGCH